MNNTRFWEIVKFCNWQDNNDYAIIRKSLCKIYTTKELHEASLIFETKRKTLSTYINTSCLFDFSDDSFSDFVAHCIGVCSSEEEYLQYFTDKGFISDVYANVNGYPPESFAYVFTDSFKSTDFAFIASDIAKLVKDKQEQYGDSFNKAFKVLEILYPEGVTPKNYPELLTVTRVLDKLFRIATDNDPCGESPWEDICGYALLAIQRRNNEL